MKGVIPTSAFAEKLKGISVCRVAPFASLLFLICNVGISIGGSDTLNAIELSVLSPRFRSSILSMPSATQNVCVCNRTELQSTPSSGSEDDQFIMTAPRATAKAMSRIVAISGDIPFFPYMALS